MLETKYTGPRVKIEGYEIGGKTGTAELINHLGQYQKEANLTSFIGVFPISKPKYLVLTIIENPKKIPQIHKYQKKIRKKSENIRKKSENLETNLKIWLVISQACGQVKIYDYLLINIYIYYTQQ